ncbi:MAG: dihydrodipicolinate synthase family protein, partial [Actinomycetes bacterium]
MSALDRGVWGVVATPFAGPSLAVDHDGLAGLVTHYERIGVVGLTVLGVFGEAAQLDTDERRAVLETVRDAVALPLVAGVTALGTAPAVEEVRQAQRVAGDRLAAVMVQVNSPNPAVLTAHLRAIHEATGAVVVVQDYPVVSGVTIGADAQVAAVRPLPFVAGVKAEAPPTP